MFSGLSKLADKSFVLGFFLPALVGVIAFIGLNRDVQPFTQLFQTSLQDKTFANLTVMLLVVWTLSVLLMAGTHWMYRVLEGYAWPLNRPGLKERQFKRRRRQRVEAREAYGAFRIAQLHCGSPTVTSAETAQEQQRTLDHRKQEYLRLKRALALEYPEQRELVLHTRFGNVLRAFETYASTVYGTESIHAWPRLLAVVPKDYQATLADARAPVDFFVSLVFLAFALGVIALVRGGAALVGKPADAMSPWIFWFSAAGAFASMRLCYLAALASAGAWGEVVKSAFDLYLPALAHAMGYELPKSAGERRRFWEAQANQFLFHEPVQPEDWPPAGSSAPVAESPPKKDADDDGDRETSDEAEAADDESSTGDDRNENRERRAFTPVKGTVVHRDIVR
ncbi:hypothetical protein [Paraburkholderia aromaticivorans]|uniref:hypothetical protein n=1 Tax=Paraburkholderia aromaticivorans TaxID=2026199 RepID=UPI001455F19C|nr:hypothetical protein [Paraburkholderia aromaticivorans]